MFPEICVPAYRRPRRHLPHRAISTCTPQLLACTSDPLHHTNSAAMGVEAFLYAYLLGGVTFLPLLVVAFVYLHPRAELDPSDDDTERQDPHEPSDALKAGEVEEKSGLATYKVGWITVTQEYLESVDEITSSTQSIAETTETRSAYSSLYKLVKNAESNPSSDSTVDGVATSESSDIIDSTNSLNNGTAKGGDKASLKSTHRKHRYYAILKHGNLFLYKNDKLKDVKHVVVLSHQVVSIWPKGLTDTLLFTKYSAILVMKKEWRRKRRLSDNLGTKDEFDDAATISVADVLDPSTDLSPPPGSFYIYCDLNIDKEDWYFALLSASKTDAKPDEYSDLDPSVHAKTLHIQTKHMINLINTLYSSEGQLQTKWLNALIGRVFLSLQQTSVLEDYLKSRIMKKLNKLKTPGFLDKFEINKLHPGNSAPVLSYPNLKEINPNGDVLLSAYVHYHGKMSARIATKLNINLGSRFKPREVDVLLSVTLEKLQGPMLIKIKPPPSGRLWYCFEIEPTMNLKIEPIISSRQFSYNIITNTIEKKFKEGIRDSLVLPHWDDITFYNSSQELYRGGIWDKSVKRKKPPAASPDLREEAGDDQRSLAEESVLTDTISIKSSSSSTKSIGSEKMPGAARLKISNTLNDFSKKIQKKPKAASTIGVMEKNCLSDGSIVGLSPLAQDPGILESQAYGNDPKLNNKRSISTLKKIGNWYFKDEKTAVSAQNEIPYTPPEMILNRRRKSSNLNSQAATPKLNTSSTSKNAPELPQSSSSITPSYDFGQSLSAEHGNTISALFDSRSFRSASTDTEEPVRGEIASSLFTDEGLETASLTKVQLPSDLDYSSSIPGALELNETQETLLAEPVKALRSLHRKPPPTTPPLESFIDEQPFI